jgi:hypothetical protein
MHTWAKTTNEELPRDLVWLGWHTPKKERMQEFERVAGMGRYRLMGILTPQSLKEEY